MDDARILEYWESRIELDEPEIQKIKKHLIVIYRGVYFEDYPKTARGIIDMFFPDENKHLDNWIPFEIEDSDLENYIKKKLMILMLEHSADGYGHRDFPYHFMVNKIMGKRKGVRKWLKYLMRKDETSPNGIFFENSSKVMMSEKISDLEKILYFFSLSNSLKGSVLNELTTNLLASEMSEELKIDIANLIMDPDDLKEFIEEMNSALALSAIKTGDLKFQDKDFVKDLPDIEPIVSEDLVNDFFIAFREIYPSDFEHTRRHVCKWELSILPVKDKKKMIKYIMDEKDKHTILGAADYLQLHSKEFDNKFLKKIVENGINSVECDVRRLFYGLAFTLLDDIEKYIDMSLNDSAKKVRNTLADVALSPYKYKDMPRDTRKKLINYVILRNVKLKKRQQGRLRKLKNKFKINS